jgi:hypothetical protein
MMSTPISLSLNEEERDFVLEVLSSYHRTLLREIARADHQEFKRELRKKEQLLESMLDRLAVHA